MSQGIGYTTLGSRLETTNARQGAAVPHPQWVDAVDRARQRLSTLSETDKLAIALHDFAAVDDSGVV
ncbi:hypothetical protein D7Y13_44085, partial [Corallococcus praedator]